MVSIAYPSSKVVIEIPGVPLWISFARRIESFMMVSGRVNGSVVAIIPEKDFPTRHDTDRNPYAAGHKHINGFPGQTIVSESSRRYTDLQSSKGVAQNGLYEVDTRCPANRNESR
jgi:hypothetical protein